MIRCKGAETTAEPNHILANTYSDLAEKMVESVTHFVASSPTGLLLPFAELVLPFPYPV